MLRFLERNLRAPLSVLLAALGAACSGSSGGSLSNADSGDAASKAFDGAGDGTADGGGDGASPDGAASSPTLIIEPDQGMAPVYAVISSAKKTLDMTMYELTDTTVTGLLTTAAGNGVTVRVILDQNLEMKNNTTAFAALSAGKVSVHWANPTYAATHQKTITVDGTTSAIMTLNLAPEYYATTRDFAVVTTDRADVAAIEATFDNDFTNTAFTPPDGDDLVWSPTNAEPALLGIINGAKATLLLENEEMSDDDVVSALSAAATRGVKVDVVMTDSKSWDANFTTLTTAGVKVVTYSPRASLYIHAKVILADYGMDEASVFVGSENFSDASLTRNRELGTVLKDPTLMAKINDTLTSDFSGGTAYP